MVMHVIAFGIGCEIVLFQEQYSVNNCTLTIINYISRFDMYKLHAYSLPSIGQEVITDKFI